MVYLLKIAAGWPYSVVVTLGFCGTFICIVKVKAYLYGTKRNTQILMDSISSVS